MFSGRRGRRYAGRVVAIAILVALALAVGTIGTAADSAARAEFEEGNVADDGGDGIAELEADPVPEPLESGSYANQSLGAGETVTYTAEVTQNDYFAVEASFDPAADVGVTVYGPDGGLVGEPLGGAGHHGVEVDGAPADGIYLVVVQNRGDAATFDLSVEHDDVSEPNPVPEPLEEGYYENQEIGAGETVTYEAALTEGDYFAVAAVFDSADDLEVRVSGPDGDPVGEPDDEEDYSYVELPEASAEDGYTVEVGNPTADAVTFDLSIEHAEPPEPDDVPEPLDSGTYRNQELGADETVTYDADVTAGDLLFVGAYSASGDVEVRIVDPDGTAVGTEIADEGGHGIAVAGAEGDGTYAVELTNRADEAASFSIDVAQESTAPLADDEGTIDGETSEHYLTDLAAGENLSIEVHSENVDVLDLAVIDPDLETVGNVTRDGNVGAIELRDAEIDGTYVVQLSNGGSDAVDYALEVTSDAADDESGENGDEDDTGSDDERENGNESDVENESENEDGDPPDSEGDGVPGMGTAGALFALVSATLAVMARSRSGER